MACGMSRLIGYPLKINIEVSSYLQSVLIMS
jgi:hypothetical protein